MSLGRSRIDRVAGSIVGRPVLHRVWVRGEGPEVDSSTEAVCRLVDDYDLPTFLAEAAEKAWISKDQLTALQRLDAALTRYAINGEDADDATRVQSPGWQKIRKRAKATLETFTTPLASA